MSLKLEINTEEDKIKLLELFNSFDTKTKIYDYFGISDNKKNRELLDNIALLIGFDFEVYSKKRRKPVRYCLNCGKLLNNNYRSKFCNHSCSAIYNNKLRGNNEICDKNIICPICGGKKHYLSDKCHECDNKLKNEKLLNRKLSDFIENKKYTTILCSTIRKNARKMMDIYNKEKVCAYCKNHEFDEILEVHHIKGILEFDLDSTIGEINSEENLVWLCPNHHAMLEKGLISLK